MKDNMRLGQLMKDYITGFTGIAIARLESMDGSVKYLLRPQKEKTSTLIEAEYFDQRTIKILDKGLQHMAIDPHYDSGCAS